MKLKSPSTSIFSIILLFSLTFVAFTAQVSAQQGYVQVKGKVRKSNSPEPGVNIAISAPGATALTVTSKDNGTYTFNLELQKDYTITFTKYGLVTKTVIFNTTVPADESDIIFDNEFNMELFDDVAGVSQNASMAKPVAKISYNPAYEDFVHDPTYTKQIQSEQLEARKAADEIKRQQERARLDSLNRVWNDSLARVKEREAKLVALRAQQEQARKDSLAKAQQQEQARAAAAAADKAKLDSIARVQAEALRLQEIAAARDRARKDSLLRADREKARQDSLAALRAAADAKAKAEAEARLREQARKDSLAAVAKAEVDRKQREADERLRLELLAKQRADSASRADAALKLRQKEIADSTAKAEQDLARRQAEEKRQAELAAKAQEKSRRDSIDAAARAEVAFKERQKFVADSTAKAVAEAARKSADQQKQAELLAARQAKAAKDSADLAERNRLERERLAADSAKAAQASLAAAEKARAAEQARQREIARRDSADKAERDRLMLIAENQRKDSLSKAEADAKARQDAIDRRRAEEERQRLALQEKNRQDSLFRAQKLAAEQEEADRKAKAYADIEAKKQQLAKSAEVTAETKAATTPGRQVAPVPKIKNSDYREGVTEEKVEESNRTIYRVVVKKDGDAINYQKIVYNWGGVYFFKNESSITQTTYDQDIKIAKASLGK
ncbi:MAG: hypothetical protein ACKO1U_05255 [Bacteroidota bacterium]